MLRLSTTRIPPHKLFHQVRAHDARVLDDLLRNFESLRQHLVRPVTQLREQRFQQFIVRPVHAARSRQVHGARMPDQPGQEERRRRFHDNAASREHKADLGILIRHADRHGQGHGDAHTDGGALEGTDDGLAAAVDGESDAAATAFRILSSAADSYD